MARNIALTITLLLGCICYAVAIKFTTLGKWQDALLFGALGSILMNLVSLRDGR